MDDFLSDDEKKRRSFQFEMPEEYRAAVPAPVAQDTTPHLDMGQTDSMPEPSSVWDRIMAAWSKGTSGTPTEEQAARAAEKNAAVVNELQKNVQSAAAAQLPEPKAAVVPKLGGMNMAKMPKRPGMDKRSAMLEALKRLMEEGNA